MRGNGEPAGSGGGKRILSSPWLPAAFMFLLFGLVAVIDTIPSYGLGSPAPRNGFTTAGGLLTWLARVLGLADMSASGLRTTYFLTLAVLFALYGWAMYLAWRRGGSGGRSFIIGCSALFCLWLLFARPVFAHDVFNYTSYGRAISMYGKNPYLAEPRFFANDPTVLYNPGWSRAVSVYGPLFNYIAAFVTWISGRSVTAAITLFKLLFFGCFIGSLFTLDSLCRRLSPGTRRFALTAVAWNPLVVILLVGGAHNDLLMILFIVLGLLLYRMEHPAASIAVLVLACMVKSTALLALGPVVILFIRQYFKRKPRDYLLSLAAVVVIPLALYLPFWPGSRGFVAMVKVGSGFSHSSIPTLVRYNFVKLLRVFGLPYARAFSIARSTVSLLSIVIFAALAVFFLWRARNYRAMTASIAGIVFAFIFTTTWLMQWYPAFLLFAVAVAGSVFWIDAASAVSFVVCFSGLSLGIGYTGQRNFPLALLFVMAGALLLYYFRWRKARGALAVPGPDRA